jgi:transposase
VDIRITAGQAGDAPVGEEMRDAIDTCEGIAPAAMDTADDSNAIRAKLVAKSIDPVIPPKANRVESIVYDKEQYKQRNKVERLFNNMKQFPGELRPGTKNSKRCSAASSHSRSW